MCLVLQHTQHAWCSMRISALALLKMAMHAKSTGTLEIMNIHGAFQLCAT